MKRSILCIDLKSFYASCECILLNKDPFTTPLVVASKTQGMGAITLAVTPYMKSLGVKSRGRLFEIPKNIKYMHIHPKMGYYIEKSKEVINVYLDFVSKEDLHVYSVDEAFLDVTNYLKYYNLTDIELGKKIMEEILNKTRLYSVCGIGENMFTAKSAMDLEAKKNPDFIAKWTNNDAKMKLKEINNLTDMWGINKNIKKKLNNLGIYTVCDLALHEKNKLIYHLGVIGEELWNHANGLDEAIICENSHIPKSVSYTSSQILFKNYNTENIKIIIKETIDILAKRLRENNKSCLTISLGITYSLEINSGFYHSISLDNYTRDNDILYENAIFLLNKFCEDYPIRKVSVSLKNLFTTPSFQTSIFKDYKKDISTNKLNNVVDTLQNKFGKNTVVKASALLKDSTILDRNKKIGGHSL